MRFSLVLLALVALTQTAFGYNGTVEPPKLQKGQFVYTIPPGFTPDGMNRTQIQQLNGENRDNPWVRLVDSIFNGIRKWSDWRAIPKPGVDAEQAFRAVHETLGSWRLKHEHKLATTGWMLSEWFEDFWFEGDTHSTIHNHQLDDLVQDG